MGNYNIFEMFENPRRGRQARNLTTNVPKILDLNSSSEQIFLACENIRFSSLFAAGDVSPAAKSEEKRMFSQAKIFSEI